MHEEMPEIKPEKLAEYTIEYPFAKTQDGELIFVESAFEGTKYICWGCNSTLFKRKSKFGIYHFYHKDSTNCTHESALHEAFKKILYKRIVDSISNNQDANKDKIKIVIQWICEKCHILKDRDLLEQMVDARLETKVGLYRPDISLYLNNSIYAVIEVEYKHPLEDNPRKYYEENNIGIIEFILQDKKDLDRTKAEPLKPNACNMCQHTALKEEENDIANQQKENQGNKKVGWLSNLLLFLGSLFVAYHIIKFFSPKTIYSLKRKLKNLFYL
jgi:hypothetical protein